VCCENSCSQTFSSLAKFKRHITNKHKDNSQILLPDQTPLLSTSTCTFDKSLDDTKNDKCIDDNHLKNTNLIDTPENINFDFNKSINHLYKSAIEFIMNLHSNNNFTFKDILTIQTGLKDKLLKPLSVIHKNIVECEIKDPLVKGKFTQFSSVLSDPFKHCNSEHNLIKWLKQNDYLENAKQFTINSQIDIVQHGGYVMYDESLTKGVLLPLRFQFRKFLELGDNFKTMYDKLINYNQCNDNTICNFIQCDVWKKKLNSFEGKIVFPFFLYADDIEINNPLGSHANYQSITAIYYNFPLNENNSSLCNIFVASLVKSVDFKEFGNNLCLINLINEINFLETEGIIVKTPHGDLRIYFVLALVLGDNLGVNTLLEFSKSFSANYFCRFCKAHKSITKHMSIEDRNLIRTIDNYSVDVLSNNFKETGIYQESILNRIKSFHVTDNFCVDIMYDLFEGVCHYNMCHIIKYYTETVQLFSLENLNNRKSAFNYGSLEVGNCSPPILDSHIKHFRLKMSAKEMWTFVHFFSLMVGDLIPHDDEIYSYICQSLKHYIMFMIIDKNNNKKNNRYY